MEVNYTHACSFILYFDGAALLSHGSAIVLLNAQFFPHI